MHERIVGLYEDSAAEFDKARSRDLFEKPWLDRFAGSLPPGGTIFDIGCGMAEPIARYFVEAGFKVTGLDSSPSLIAMCRARFPEQEWIVGDMRTLDLGRRFDGLVLWHSSFHLAPDDQRALLARLADHTHPGGYIMFTSGDEAGERIGEWQGEPLYHASLAREEYRGLLSDNGFEVIDCRFNNPESGNAAVWLARRVR